jgi:hypothetical protein
MDDLVARTSQTLGRPWKWLRPLAKRYQKAFSNGLRPRHRDVVKFLSEDAGFLRALNKHADAIRIEHWLNPPQPMQPVRVGEAWPIPAIETVGALADRLSVTPSELDWFADLKAIGYKDPRPRLRHYSYRILRKPSGTVRLIEAPKWRLKQMQRQILSEILDKVPAHSAAHGFIKGRSIKTFTAPHVAQMALLRMDLSDFFPSFCGARIQAIFRTIGYPEPIADLLGGICTNATPRDIWNDPSPNLDLVILQEARAFHARPHLPQGAPTSPALANIGAYRADCRLAGLACAAGASYTRYADDLVFSGSERFDASVDRFATHAAAILIEEGFSVNHRKTRVMRQNTRQHLAGLVVNRRANIARADFDRLKATLTNCLRLGPENQNRHSHPDFRAHLEGRVSFAEMVNPEKGIRLRRIFEEIQWS